ncbi:GLPGLI family protein [Myroides odoratus]|uniref:GLPGLI family protein n=1 Tax=Myroides odoratus TaxID=256 RepID=UPI0039B0FF61
MKKIYYIFLLLLLAIQTHAQEQIVMRYNYVGKLVLDKTQPQKIDESVFVLDIDSTQSSRFLELALLERKRGTATIKNQDELIQVLHTYRPKTDFMVFAENTTLETLTSIGRVNYSYTQPQNTIIWKIEPNSQQWNSYTVQRATTFFEGRQWNVLFTSEIPLIEGPYKFKNLPGFVVKAWDDENQYEFEFINSEKVTIDNWDLSNPKEIVTSITPAQYEKVLKIYHGKTYRDLLIEMNPKNAETAPAEFAEKIGLRSNPIYKVQ